ncbi:MAG TPA: DUF4136 domain-containing protein [Cyclobacteriaceae bacterium]|jgi:hypothetical protein|nr:DUF4136 domain-containing protein [Cyclobacteriaceae bacterium]
MKFLTIVLSLLSFCATAQEIKIEYDKKHDFSKYKTFAFGESQVITPVDQKQVSDATVDKWVKNGVTRELESKGLKRTDSLADLVVTYVIGTMERSDAQAIGPLGMTPGSDARTWSRDYKQTSVIVDLNNRSRFLVWRVNAVIDALGTDAEKTIDMAIVRGFKKYPKPKK